MSINKNMKEFKQTKKMDLVMQIILICAGVVVIVEFVKWGLVVFGVVER